MPSVSICHQVLNCCDEYGGGYAATPCPLPPRPIPSQRSGGPGRRSVTLCTAFSSRRLHAIDEPLGDLGGLLYGAEKRPDLPRSRHGQGHARNHSARVSVNPDEAVQIVDTGAATYA